MEHEITVRKSPIAELVRCSCGWTAQVTRRQNALARAAKVRSAIFHHLKRTEEKTDA